MKDRRKFLKSSTQGVVALSLGSHAARAQVPAGQLTMDEAIRLNRFLVHLNARSLDMASFKTNPEKYCDEWELTENERKALNKAITSSNKDELSRALSWYNETEIAWNFVGVNWLR